jgi:hypothetical protein
MTASGLPGLPAADTPAAARPQSAPAGAERRTAPVIVLTHAYSGSQRLQSVLSSLPGLACTSGTGLLPACDQAATAWRQAERRGDGTLSPLAIASVRALAAGMITAILARTGRQRWCETAIVQQDSAETFLKLYPDTQFLCLHRACPDMIHAALEASPWGLSGQAFAPFTASYPASTVAALAAYWAAHAGALLAFERAHPGACLRVRHEDLAASPDQAARDIRAFLGLAEECSLPPWPAGEDGAPGSAGPDPPGRRTNVPAGQIPPPLLAQVDDLLAKLAYPPLGPVS